LSLQKKQYDMKRSLQLLILSLIVISCSDVETERKQTAEIAKLQLENDSLHKMVTQKPSAMEQQISTSLTFQKNDAEQAMNFYVSLFDNSKITDIQRWGEAGPGQEGTIMQARFELNGKKYLCSDSPPVHNWDFTPAIANYVECSSADEIRNLYEKLSEGGEIAMYLDNYGFSAQFAWVMDRFGVSWQLNLQ